MNKFFEYGFAGASLSGIIGGAVGTILTGIAIAAPGVNLIAAPLAVAATAAASSASATAVGTLVGGSVGGAVGAVEDAEERKKRNDKKEGE